MHFLTNKNKFSKTFLFVPIKNNLKYENSEFIVLEFIVIFVRSIEQKNVQQGLEIHGLEKRGPWRYMVFNWFPKHSRYTDFGQKP